MDSAELAKRCAGAMYAQDAASKALGIGISVRAAGEAIARMTVREDMVNGFGVCHGGLLFALADTAFAFACNGYDDRSFAAAATIDFMRPALLGEELRALAREDYRGSRSGFYTVEVRNERDEVVAMFRGRSATRGERLLKNDTDCIEKSGKA